MKVYVVTGESELSRPERIWVAGSLHDKLADADAIVTGGAYGTDTVALMEGIVAAPSAKLVICVPHARWNTSLTTSARHLGVDVILRRARLGRDDSESYMLRNSLMVDTAIEFANSVRSDVEMLAYPRRPVEEQRSGTWATVRRGRAAGITVTIRAIEG